MLPDKVPTEEMLHASTELKKQAYVGSFEKYKEFYNKSVDSPEGIIINFIISSSILRFINISFLV